jgi:hypothetical protein
MNTSQSHEPWNKGKLIGQKSPLRLKDIWAIRFHLQQDKRIRDLALFNLAIDSKLRGCDLVDLRVRDITHGNQIMSRAMVMQRKTQRPVQFELTVLSRLPKAAVPEVEAPVFEAVARTAGRPKLGVVPREVTLLPRHWEWLATQPGGASVALRKLVESASRANETKDRIRQAQEAAYRFMSTMAGNLPGYEEAVRTLFADKPEQFGLHTEAWPADVRDHARMIALRAFTV